MILLLDNYDSFTYNLAQCLLEMSADVAVFRNDAVTLEKIAGLKPAGIVISPGPGRPENAGATCDIIRAFAATVPLLGVCLGHQALGHVFGASVVHAQRLMHGKTSDIAHDGEGVFKGLGEKPFKAMRYHSLALDRASLPGCLRVTATSDDGEIMGVRHTDFPAHGIQFHPESIMTPCGKRILRNFLEMTP